MRPAHQSDSKSPRASSSAKRKKASIAPPEPMAIGQGPPRPIGPEALKALREAIKSGKYPSDAVVVRGLVRMIRKP